ncbi:hypothetical protein [Streptomyces sp. NPDC002671]
MAAGHGRKPDRTRGAAAGYLDAAPLLTLVRVLAGCELFLVAFGDDVLLEDTPGGELAAMHCVAHEDGADAVIAAQPVTREEIASFGVVEPTTPGGERVAIIRQRPDAATVDEPLAVVSRLVLRPPILTGLAARPEARGEVDLGLAVGDLARAGDVRVHRLAAQWMTVGEPHRYSQAMQLWLARSGGPATIEGNPRAC